MKLESIGETIAARNLSLISNDGPPSEVLVLLGKPMQTPGHDDFYCPYQIKGVGAEKVRYMCGIDAFQALQLAMRALAADWEVLNRNLGGNLRWEGDEEGWLGFPHRFD